MADWYAYYDTRTGELVSQGTVRPARLRRNIAEVYVGTSRPPKGWVWNTTLHIFEDKVAEYLAEQEALRTEDSPLRNLEEQVKTERTRLESSR